MFESGATSHSNSTWANWVFEDFSKTRLKTVIIVLKTSCAQMAQLFKRGLSDWHLLVWNFLLSFNPPEKGKKKKNQENATCWSNVILIVLLFYHYGQAKTEPIFFFFLLFIFSIFFGLLLVDTCHKWSSKIISFKYNLLC